MPFAVLRARAEKVKGLPNQTRMSERRLVLRRNQDAVQQFEIMSAARLCEVVAPTQQSCALLAEEQTKFRMKHALLPSNGHYEVALVNPASGAFLGQRFLKLIRIHHHEDAPSLAQSGGAKQA